MIYVVVLRLNRCNSFSRCRAIAVEKRKKKKKSEDARLATCRSGTLAMLSSKVNGPAAHGNTQ